MSIRIVVVSDTHCNRWEEVHPDTRRAVSEADIAVHCGDFTGMGVVEGVRRMAKKAVMVHGNMDPPEVRRALPRATTFEVEGRRIGVTHPAWGGPTFDLADLLPDFAGPVDAVLYGHLHETENTVRDGVFFLNPGQGFSSANRPATIAVLTVGDGAMSAEIRVIQEKA